MLSYRHAFHAANHADVLKHLVLLRVLRYLNQKDKPYWYIDTHAGAGAYGLDAGYALQNAEHAAGLATLWSVPDLPEPLADYVAIVRRLNAEQQGCAEAEAALRFYPGSPYLAEQMLRAEDRLRLFELHPTDSMLLAQTFQGGGRRVKVEPVDGFAGLKSLLPPPPRRAVVLIDPSYEDKRDYVRVLEAVKDSRKRFATGTYLIWYPQLARAEAQRLPERLRSVPCHWLDVSLSVRRAVPNAAGLIGMYGSGLFVINPPWTLAAELRACLPTLVAHLGQDSGARFELTLAPT